MSQITRERPASSASVSAQPLKSATRRRKPKYDYRDEIRRTPILQHSYEELLNVTQVDVDAKSVHDVFFQLVWRLRGDGCSFAAILSAYPEINRVVVMVAQKIEPLTVSRLYRESAAPYPWGWLVGWRMCNGKSMEPVIRDAEGHEFFVSQKLLQKL